MNKLDQKQRILNSRIRKCINVYKADPINLFNRMGRSFQLDDNYILYLDCVTRIGVKINESSYILAGSICPIVIISDDHYYSDHFDDYRLDSDELEGNIYYFCETESNRISLNILKENILKLFVICDENDTFDDLIELKSEANLSIPYSYYPDCVYI